MSSPTSNQRPLRVVFVGARDSGGGAARATYRIFDSLWQRQEELGLDISMRVIHKTTDHPGIIGGAPQPSTFQRRRTLLVKRWRRLVRRKRFFSPHTVYSSPAEFDTGLGQELLEMNADLYVLNWLGSKTLSIREIGKLGNRVVWRSPDMWAFSGAEHYRTDSRAERGYSRASRSEDESGPDLNRRIFRLKKRFWREPMVMIAPTSWLASEARKSQLATSWKIYVQPHPIDLHFWKARDRKEARARHNVGQDEVVILYGAAGGTKHPHKGADLLFEALKHLGAKLESERDPTRIRLLIFGETAEKTRIGRVPIEYLGVLEDDDLISMYSCADLLVIPSRLENFAQVGVEGHSCGLPIVAFDKTGLADVLEDGVSGYLARNGDALDLSEKIHLLIKNSEIRRNFSIAARKRAIDLWQQESVSKRYARILHEIAATTLPPILGETEEPIEITHR